MHLTREVRFSLSAAAPEPPVLNSWGGWPAGGVLSPYVVLRVTVRGVVDARTGYLCNINLIDRAVRDRALPALRAAWLAQGDGLTGDRAVMTAAGSLEGAFPGGVELAGIRLHATPFLSYFLDPQEPSMVAVTQSFEFAAAHRLYCADLSPAENQKVFGKCTNPNGHGHNYIVEVTVAGEPDGRTGVVIELGRLEQVVKARVIDVFDHKHLNADCPEFAALNPSVENITQVIWSKLDRQFAPAKLTCVRVYETPKTYAECRGSGNSA